MSKKNKVRNIFDSIAFKYDFLNHLLSLGIDFYWRKKALRLTKPDKNSFLLDIACGTGDFAIKAKKMGLNNIFGGDFSLEMLKLFSKKANWIKGNSVQLVAEHLPFKDESFNNIIVAFGVRNFYDYYKGLASFYRILKKGGKATILEFRLPSNLIFKNLYKFYFIRILPFIGGLFSGDREAYEYLPKSVEEFDEKINLVEILSSIGFTKISQHSLTLGIVQVIIAEK